MVASAQWWQASLIGVLAALTTLHAGRLAVLYALAFALGVADTAVRAASQKLVPAVVSSVDLERANGLQNASMFATKQFLGPPVGGLLFAIATPLPFWFGAASFIVSALLLAPHRGTDSETAPRRALRVEVGEGLRWLLAHRVIRTLSVLAGVGNLCNFLAMSTFVLFAQQRLGLGGLGYGFLLGAMAVGGVTGSLLSRLLVTTFGGRAVATATIFTTPTAMLAIGLTGHQVVVVAALAMITSFGASVWNVAVSSLRQRIVPAAMFGRVGSAGSLISWGAQPIGALLGGLLAGWLGLAAPWLIGGTLRIISAVLALPALCEWQPEREPSMTAPRT